MEADAPILVVDDDPDVRAVIADILARDNRQVIPARDYYSALAIWSERTRDFALVIVDYVLDERTGIELAELIWADRPAARVILMTGFRPELLPIEDATRTRLRFLGKPFTVATFRSTVDGVLKENG